MTEQTQDAPMTTAKEQRAARNKDVPLSHKINGTKKAAKAEKPAKAAAKKADAKVAKSDKPKKPSRIESDSENIRAIVKLASRPQGATKHELEAATGWKNAGWPWMFFNKKTGKGIAPRFNMKFEVIERPAAKEGERSFKAYKLTPIAG